MKPEIQPQDLEIALPIIDSIAPKVILEIGTYLGGSACMWRDRYNPEILVSVDNIQRCTPPKGVETIIGDSGQTETLNKVEKLLKGKKVDLLFLDGDHMAEAVRRDFELYAPLVRQGGLIMFHDIFYRNAENDVPTFWKEIKRHYNFIEIAQNNKTTGVGIITKDTAYERTEYGNIT